MFKQFNFRKIGVIAKGEFSKVGPHGDAILNKLVKNGILEEVSPTEVRSKVNLARSKHRIQKIAGSNFEKIWSILQQPRSRCTRVIGWSVFFLFLLMIVLVRYRLLNIPLERDEGEYAYCGQLLLQGVTPFQLAYSLKLPGTCAMYALFMALFGQTTQGIHLGLLFVNVISVFLIFFISKRLFGFIAGIFSGISYAILSVSQSVVGAHAHATHFVVVMALAGILFLLKAVEGGKKKDVFLSGLFFGLAFVMKQQGVFFIPFGFLYLSWVCFKKRPVLREGAVLKLIIYIIGAILPFAAVCLGLFCAGVFNKFWFWTVQYATHYLSHIPLSMALKVFIEYVTNVMGPFKPIWYFAALGYAGLFIDSKAREHIFFVTTFFVASVCTVCVGFMFRQHYFVTVLPVISILAGYCVSVIGDRMRSSFLKFVPMIVFVGLAGCCLYQQKQYLFELPPAQISKMTYNYNPFGESMEIAKYVQAHTSVNDTIAVLGSEPQICFYAHRRSATGYIYTYPLVENQPFALRMQQEMIHDIESAKPLYLITVHVETSWLWHPGAEKLIAQWSDKYVPAHYVIAGVVDIFSDRTDYYWDAAAQNVEPRSPYFVLVFKRRSL